MSWVKKAEHHNKRSHKYPSKPGKIGRVKTRMLSSTTGTTTAKAQFNPSRVSSALTEQFYP
jgi:hypothetical protein